MLLIVVLICIFTRLCLVLLFALISWFSVATLFDLFSWWFLEFWSVLFCVGVTCEFGVFMFGCLWVICLLFGLCLLCRSIVVLLVGCIG